MSHTNKQEQLALLLAYRLLRELLNPKQPNGVSEHVREQARIILRHFPVPVKIDLLYQSVKKEN